MLSRREVVRLLAAGVLAPGCAARRTPQPAVPRGPLTLGWRFVPGMRLSWRSVVTRSAGEVRVTRSEEWTWLVRDLDVEGVATLEGRLTGLGAGAEVGGAPLPDAAVAPARDAERRAASTPITLRLRMDGRLVSCSADGFGDALRHRLLALRLPTRPVSVLDTWDAPDLTEPFASLLPLDLEVEARGETRLDEVHARDGAVYAALGSHGRVRTRAGTALTVDGTASWDVTRGRLASRHVEVRPAGSSSDGSHPGLLTVRVFPTSSTG